MLLAVSRNTVIICKAVGMEPLGVNQLHFGENGVYNRKLNRKPSRLISFFIGKNNGYGIGSGSGFLRGMYFNPERGPLTYREIAHSVGKPAQSVRIHSDAGAKIVFVYFGRNRQITRNKLYLPAGNVCIYRAFDFNGIFLPLRSDAQLSRQLFISQRRLKADSFPFKTCKLKVPVTLIRLLVRKNLFQAAHRIKLNVRIHTVPLILTI